MLAAAVCAGGICEDNWLSSRHLEPGLSDLLVQIFWRVLGLPALFCTE